MFNYFSYLSPFLKLSGEHLLEDASVTRDPGYFTVHVKMYVVRPLFYVNGEMVQ